MNIEALRKLLKDKVKGLTDLETKAAADGATDDDVAALEAANTEIEALEKKLKALERSEAARAKHAKPASDEIDTKAGEDDDDDPQPAQVKKVTKIEEKLGLIMMGMVKAQATAGFCGEAQTLKAIEDLGYARFAKEFAGLSKKNLISANASAGGILVPENFVPEIIPLLYPNTTFFQGSPRRIPMPGGTMRQVAGATGATASYRGEARPMGVSHATFREMNMSAKLLAGITTISDQLMRYSLADAAAYARTDLAQAMSIVFDSKSYFGSGSTYEPLGLLNIPGIPTSAFAAVAPTAPTFTEFDTAGRQMEQAMVNVNLPMEGAEWRMSYRTFAYMADLRDGLGNRIYPELQGSNPTWRSKPVRWTTQFPNTLGGGANESVIALIAFGHVYYGDTLAMQFKITRDATIVNGGTTIHTWQDGVMGMAFEWEHDVGVRYTEAVVTKTGVRAGG